MSRNTGIHTVSKYSNTGSLINSALINIASPGADGIAIDSSGNIYVADSVLNKISKYDASGALLDGTFLTGLGGPEGISFDSSGSLYVANSSANTVQKYLSGTNLQYTIAGISGAQFAVADDSGNLFTSAGNGNVVGWYDSNQGLAINTGYVSGVGSPEGMAVIGGTLFYVDYNNNLIGSKTIGGIGLNSGLVTGLNSPFGLAVVSAIPEPSVYAALIGLSALLAAALRRRPAFPRA
jgi:hypothetical protein